MLDKYEMRHSPVGRGAGFTRWKSRYAAGKMAGYQASNTALEHGINLLDTVPCYVNCEEFVRATVTDLEVRFDRLDDGRVQLE